MAKAKWPGYGISLIRSRHARDFSMESIRRPYFKIFLVSEGWTILRVNGLPIRLNTNQCAAVPKETPHRLEDSGTREVTLQILSIRDQAFSEGTEERALLDSLNADPGLPQLFISPFSGVFGDFIELFRHIRWEQSENLAGEALRVKAAVTTLLVELLRARSAAMAQSSKAPSASTVADKIRQAGALIRRNFAEPVSIAELAGSCDMTANRFIGAFKAQFNMPPLRYLHQARIAYAKKRLTGSNDAISKISLESGFNDLSFFYKIFRKLTGKPPRAYRDR